MSRAANLCYKQWSRPQMNQLTSPEITCSDTLISFLAENWYQITVEPLILATLNFGV